MPERAGWTDDLATGNPAIDDQHREIFRRAGLLLDKINLGGVSDNEVKETVQFLTNYVEEHFGMEEVLQRLYKYPDLEAHKSKHDAFIKNFHLLKEKCEAGWAPRMAEELVRLVVNWLMDHIRKEDKAVADHIRKARG